MKVIACLVIFAALALALPTEEHYKFAFDAWKQQYNKVYNGDEMTRYRIFKTNVDFIENQNARGLSYELGLNQFADMSNREFKRMFHSIQVHKSGVKVTTNAPDSIDWVAKGAVVPVKNQGQCGSCWAFASIGAIESLNQIKNGKLVAFSEQQLVDCVILSAGCKGGSMDAAFNYAIDQRLCTEKEYPYTAKDEDCKEYQCETHTIDGFDVVNPYDEDSLKNALATQPVTVGVQADQTGFQFYKSGVFDGECGTEINHGVLAVGYGEADGKKYWNIKNSWGTTWGEQGFIRLVRNDGWGKAGQCGITLSASYPTIKSTVTEAAEQPNAIWSDCSGGKGMVKDIQVTLTPEVPRPGKELHIVASATLESDITAGAKVSVWAKWEGMKLISETVDLCSQVTCPIAKGPYSIDKTVTIPGIAPGGHYEAHVEGKTASGELIACINANFKM